MTSVAMYEKAAHRAVSWLLAQYQPDGSYGQQDLACYYKSPAVLGLSGHPREARQQLALILTRFRTETGDFETRPGTKSDNPIFQEFWSYPNGWIALAAARQGWFGPAREAYAHLLTYRTPDGGFSATTSGIPDAISTAHIGLLALTLGDLEVATAAGDWLTKLLVTQPALSSRFHLRMDDSGPLRSDSSPLHVLETGAAGMPYFMIGYPLAYLTRLHQVTGDPAHLTAAIGYADYAHSCGENLRTTQLSHKVAWGAAILHRHTGDHRHRDLATAIAAHLLESQADNGSWSPDGPPHATFDDTAEIAHWLLEIAAELAE